MECLLSCSSQMRLQDASYRAKQEGSPGTRHKFAPEARLGGEGEGLCTARRNLLPIGRRAQMYAVVGFIGVGYLPKICPFAHKSGSGDLPIRKTPDHFCWSGASYLVAGAGFEPTTSGL